MREGEGGREGGREKREGGGRDRGKEGEMDRGRVGESEGRTEGGWERGRGTEDGGREGGREEGEGRKEGGEILLTSLVIEWCLQFNITSITP